MIGFGWFIVLFIAGLILLSSIVFIMEVLDRLLNTDEEKQVRKPKRKPFRKPLIGQKRSNR